MLTNIFGYFTPKVASFLPIGNSRCLVEALVLEVLCLFLGGFLLDEIELPGLLLEVLLGELRLGLTFGL